MCVRVPRKGRVRVGRRKAAVFINRRKLDTPALPGFCISTKKNIFIYLFFHFSFKKEGLDDANNNNKKQKKSVLAQPWFFVWQLRFFDLFCVYFDPLCETQVLVPHVRCGKTPKRLTYFCVIKALTRNCAPMRFYIALETLETEVGFPSELAKMKSSWCGGSGRDDSWSSLSRAAKRAGASCVTKSVWTKIWEFVCIVNVSL